MNSLSHSLSSARKCMSQGHDDDHDAGRFYQGDEERRVESIVTLQFFICLSTARHHPSRRPPHHHPFASCFSLSLFLLLLLRVSFSLFCYGIFKAAIPNVIWIFLFVFSLICCCCTPFACSSLICVDMISFI